MIIKASEMKLLDGDKLISKSIPKFFLFDEEGKQNAEMISNALFRKMTTMQSMVLAAPQVDLDIQLFVMGSEEIRFIAFNPQVIYESKETETAEEFSASFPGIFLKIKRPKEIVVNFQGANGQLYQQRLEGLTARIFLHGMDYMKGKTFMFHASQLKIDFAEKKLKNKKAKIIKKHARKILTGQVGK